jgi:hypothetical protein
MLGHGRSVRELVLVQRALREAGVELGSAGDDGFAELVELAEHSGSSGLVALDLITDLSGLLVAGEG